MHFLRIFAVAAAGSDNPPLRIHAVEGSVDMVIHTSNVPVIRPNLVDVLGNCFEPEPLVLPRVISIHRMSAQDNAYT